MKTKFEKVILDTIEQISKKDKRLDIIIPDTNVCIKYCDKQDKRHGQIVKYLKPLFKTKQICILDIVLIETAVILETKIEKIEPQHYKQLVGYDNNDQSINEEGWEEYTDVIITEKESKKKQKEKMTYQECTISLNTQKMKYVMPQEDEIKTIKKEIEQMSKDIKNDPSKKTRVKQWLKNKQKNNSEITLANTEILGKNDVVILGTAAYFTTQNKEKSNSLDVVIITSDSDFTVFAKEIYKKFGVIIINAFELEKHMMGQIKKPIRKTPIIKKRAKKSADINTKRRTLPKNNRWT